MLFNYLFFTAPLEYIIQGYFRLFPVFTIFLLASLKKNENDTQILIYTLIVAFFTIWPILIINFLLCNFNWLNNINFFTRYKSLYKNIKETSPSALSFYAIHALRRFDIVVVNLVFS